MNVVAQTLSGWFFHQDDLRARLHAFARSVFASMPRRLTLRPFQAPMSATRSAQGSTVAHRGSSPGVSPAPPVAFLSAAGWAPALPAELGTPPPARLTTSGALRPTVDARQGERRFSERRIRNDGSPYGVERRRRPEDRATERRAAPEPPRSPASAVRLDRGPYAVREGDYVPYLQDLLKRLHGR
jgi:hypothetical protein